MTWYVGVSGYPSPAGPVISCSVAAGLHLLETRVIQPAAMRHLGSRVVAIDHAGSYSCRRLYGRSEGVFSEHATADAIDIIGFRLANGTRVSVLRDWEGDTPKAEFLRDVYATAGTGSFEGIAAHPYPHHAPFVENMWRELDALRANKANTDPARKVRFLPYGIAVSVLDATE